MSVVVPGDTTPEREEARLPFPEAGMAFKFLEELSTTLLPRIEEIEGSVSGLEKVSVCDMAVGAFPAIFIFLSSSPEAFELMESLTAFLSSIV